MPEPTTVTDPAQTPVRLFPWFCPRCRRKEVRRTTMPYQCSRVYKGQQIAVIVEKLSVPRCDNCGELVFDYLAEEQINQAFKAQTLRVDGQTNGRNGEQRQEEDGPNAR
jgi:hypothetical protein